MLDIVGSLCFGLVIGWATHAALNRWDEPAALSATAAVIGAVGGGAAAASVGIALLAWYCVGFASASVLRSVLCYASSLGRAGRRLDETRMARRAEPWLDETRMAEPSRSVWRRLDSIIGLDRLLRTSIPVDESTSPPVRDEQAPAKPPRYANATLFDSHDDRRLDPGVSLSPGQALRLRLDIGKLSPESHVRRPAPFPDDRLPEDIDLDVMVSSTDFVVYRELDRGLLSGDGSVAHGRFFLPGNGCAASVAEGGEALWFLLTAPEKTQQARCRIGYYYRNVLVQSQLLAAAVGEPGGFRIETDYTLSADLTHLNDIPERPRISILVNANGAGVHQIVLRSPEAPFVSAAKGQTFAMKEENLGRAVKEMRKALRERAPTERRRSPEQLAGDLRRLAPAGYSLWTQVPGQNPQFFFQIYEDPARYVIQVARPTTSGFVFPWSLIYDIPLLDLDNLEVCRLISGWDGASPLVNGSLRQCPHGPHPENVLCPFGFWGFRYTIEQLSATDEPVLEIPAPNKWDFVVAETRYGVDDKKLSAHVTNLRDMLGSLFPGGALSEGRDKKSIRSLLGRDLPLVYFYCHGEGRHDDDPNPYLGVGVRESIRAEEIPGWVQAWWLRDKKVIWDKIRPLVFINACHSLEIHPETLVSYLDAFVGGAHAAGVIGTEVKVNQNLAMMVAESFFRTFLSEQATVESALRAVRMDFLANGNLLGLLYTPYCWAELKLARSTTSAKPP